MSLHDEYARRTPFEVAFPDPAEAESLFRTVEEEAEAQGRASDDFHQFVALAAVRDSILELSGAEGPAGALHPYGVLAFHAFHFAAAGHRLDLVSTAAIRGLVDDAPAGRDVEAPGRAGYVQLPQHLFWTSVTPGEPPQSVDGLFWTLGANGLLHVMLALALRPDQGLGVVPLPEAPWADRAAWLEGRMREDGADFASSLPGAELDNLYGFESAGEVLKLLSRVFAQISSHPPQGHAPAATDQAPAPSAFPFNRVDTDA